jgi:hypothetical protein
MSPPQNDSRTDIPLNLSFFVNFFSGFENLIPLSVILRHLEAELSIQRCLIKLIRGVISTFKKKFLNPFTTYQPVTG